MKKPISPSADTPRPIRRRSSLTEPAIRDLRDRLDELSQLPTRELLDQLDLHRAGADFERLAACTKNMDTHIHSEELDNSMRPEQIKRSRDTNNFSSANNCYKTNDANYPDKSNNPNGVAERYSSIALSPEFGMHSDDPGGHDPCVNDYQELEVFEIAGVVKWFDSSKGYGFVVADNGLPDCLLHITCLRAGGYQTAYEGARIHCLVLRRPKGMQAFRILSMDESTAIHPSLLPQRTHVIVQPESDWERAMVKWFNRVRGFGYLTRGEGTPDIFVHMEILRRFGFTELRPGEIVRVRWGHGAKGCMAAELARDKPGNEAKGH